MHLISDISILDLEIEYLIQLNHQENMNQQIR